MDEQDFGKVRVYRCVCGGTPVRPLRGEPKPCDHCLSDLTTQPCQIEDHLRFVERLLDQPPGSGSGIC